MSRWHAVDAGAVRLEVLDAGAGEPVLFVQTALTADELAPTAERLGDRFRTVLLHRRGYGDSSAADGPGSIVRDAVDCRALLDALRIRRAHVVGLSYSGAVALQLAADSLERVRTLTLIEPPPVHVASAPEFRAAIERLVAIRGADGADAALEAFMSALVGPDWRAASDERLPGAVAQMRRDAATFFDVDLPALTTWRFTRRDAARIRCPVLHVGGTASGTWFAEVRRLVLDWFPDAEDVRIDGADHSLALTHPDALADAVSAFARRHSLG